MNAGAHIALTGRFYGLSHQEVGQRLARYGLHASSSLRGETRALLCGARPSATRVEEAKEAGLPVLEDRALRRLLAGAPLEWVLSDVGHPDAPAPVNATLTELRAILHSAPRDKGTWSRVCWLIDHTDTREQVLAAQYAAEHLRATAEPSDPPPFGAYYRTQPVPFPPPLAPAPLGDCWVQLAKLGDDAAEALLGAVRSLKLPAWALNHDENARAVGAHALMNLQHPRWEALEALHVENTEASRRSYTLTGGQLRALPASLRSLTLKQVDLTWGAWAAIAEALPELTDLTLIKVRLQGTLRPARAVTFRRLTTLSVLGDANLLDAELSVTAPALAGLTRLSARDARLQGHKAVARLTERLGPDLHTLDLSGNTIGSQGLLNLLRADLPGLRTLLIRGCALNAQALAAFSRPSAIRLKRLDLARNIISGADWSNLADGEIVDGLTHLGLAATPVTGEGAGALIRAPALQALEVLNLEGCNPAFLDVEGALQELERWLPRLRELWFREDAPVELERLRRRWR